MVTLPTQPEPFPTTLIIQQALSPAVAMSASALLALGMHNRLSSVINRLRSLNQEARLSYQETSPAKPASPLPITGSLRQQQHLLLTRGRLLRNGLLCTNAAVASLTGCAFAIALGVLGALPLGDHWAAGLFLLGLLLMAGSLVFETLEVSLLLKALKLDVADTMPGNT
ncbi:MAG: DUF2721 domain-containing protein [Vampirovibrionales bacterium]|nr:DUF2721 domain-containing protein [Vampirovibrionales bacterium]